MLGHHIMRPPIGLMDFMGQYKDRGPQIFCAMNVKAFLDQGHINFIWLEQICLTSDRQLQCYIYKSWRIDRESIKVSLVWSCMGTASANFKPSC